MPHRLDTSVFGRETSLVLSGQWAAYWVGFLRLLVGWWFLHSGLHKYATPGSFDASWYLIGATEGTIVYPITSAFGASAAGTAFVNVTIPIAEVLIGLGLILGALTRLAAFFGAVLMTFFYFGNADWSHGFVNGDLMGLLLFVTLIVFGAGRVWGVDEYLERSDLVRNNPWLRYLLG